MSVNLKTNLLKNLNNFQYEQGSKIAKNLGQLQTEQYKYVCRADDLNNIADYLNSITSGITGNVIVNFDAIQNILNYVSGYVSELPNQIDYVSGYVSELPNQIDYVSGYVSELPNQIDYISGKHNELSTYVYNLDFQGKSELVIASNPEIISSNTLYIDIHKSNSIQYKYLLDSAIGTPTEYITANVFEFAEYIDQTSDITDKNKNGLLIGSSVIDYVKRKTIDSLFRRKLVRCEISF